MMCEFQRKVTEGFVFELVMCKFQRILTAWCACELMMCEVHYTGRGFS